MRGISFVSRADEFVNGKVLYAGLVIPGCT